MNWIPSTETLRKLTGSDDIEQLRSLGGSHAIYGTADAAYRPRGGVSQSFLKSMRPTPAHACMESEDKPHFRIGRYVHQAVLTPHDPLPEFAVYPETYTGDKGEEKPWNMNVNACKRWVAQQIELGRTPLPRKEFDIITGCVCSVAENETAKRMFGTEEDKSGKIVTNGDAEVSLFALCNIGGTEFVTKARVDWAPKKSKRPNVLNSLVDVKTVQRGESGARDFSRCIKYDGYGLQAAFYLRLWNQCHRDDQRDSFIWVVVEKGQPFVVQFYVMEGGELEPYRIAAQEALETFAESVASGVFRGDNNQLQRVEL